MQRCQKEGGRSQPTKQMKLQEKGKQKKMKELTAKKFKILEEAQQSVSAIEKQLAELKKQSYVFYEEIVFPVK